MKFEKLFRLALAVSGLSQSEWARRSGMSVKTVQRVLKGKYESSGIPDRVRVFVAEQRARLVALLADRKAAMREVFAKSRLFKVACVFLGISADEFMRRNSLRYSDVADVIEGHCDKSDVVKCVDDFIECECCKLENELKAEDVL